jgi:16S rRNA (uracil1498-N3)-methyltransferase
MSGMSGMASQAGEPGEPGGPGPAMAPDPRLVGAATLVFVADLRAPTLDPADARHLLDVLRLRPGEPVVVSDGAGSWMPCRVSPATAGRSGRTAEPGSIVVADGEVVVQPAVEPRLTIAFAPVKGDRPEWVVQKLTELGVDTIVPIHTRRSVVRWEGDRSARAVERLRRVAVEAAGQCRRPRLPEILPVSTIGDLADLTGVAPALAHPGGGRPTLGHRVVAIGPEGGWDDSELGGGGSTVGLGPTVLRAETAAVVAGALLCALRATLIAPLA